MECRQKQLPGKQGALIALGKEISAGRKPKGWSGFSLQRQNYNYYVFQQNCRFPMIREHGYFGALYSSCTESKPRFALFCLKKLI